MPRWSAMPIPYWINDRGSSQIANGSEFTAVRAAFQTWQNIPTADIRFDYKGTTPVRTAGRDGLNLISFSDDSTPLGSSTIAATFSYFKNDLGTVVFDESDIIFNTALDFSTSGEENKFDIHSVLTHEIGHLLGLDHSGLVSSVMVPFAASGQLDQRKLEYDDIAAIMEIYPRASAVPAVGEIRGTITSGTTNVFGAHVVAVDSDGTALVSTISQPDGSYVLRYLPPGTYRIYAEPLDLPVTEQHIGGGSNSYYHNLKTDFGTTYFGNVPTLSDARTTTVAAGGVATADIQVLSRSSTGLNLTRPGFSIRIPRSSRGTLMIGGSDIVSPLSFSGSNAGLIFGSPTFGDRLSSTAPTSASMSLSIDASTALGPKNVEATRGSTSTVVSGAIVITDPRPSNIAVAGSSGPIEGGTPVTITGANFVSGAQVTFAGLPASGVRVIDSGTIQATAPANSPGTVNVQVINPNGTWGTATRAFTYITVPPTILRASPLSGPPTTAVAIEGEHFDTRTQNIEVRFNGVPARVTSATANLIITVVPFGATSGPITVSVFGQGAIGPNFTVTAARPSANLATSAYNFVDASTSSGGTALSFSSQDDAVAFVNLPFDFSLFRDIYLAGSRISIATNGWLSLETVSSAEFQNASLPAQTVTRPGGSTGTVPPSLIAPFWDDLLLKSGSTVTYRTIGTAPNRRFVVEWSNVSILDEQGNDLNASLTFEAILFEGSNDIQFVYQTLTGTRSDGSSATIGAQDLKRTTAFQTGFNQAVVNSGFFIIYRFRDGSYGAVTPDVTPPTKPVVTDGGALTASRTELSASWTAEDPESGIREYQYAIGKTPGGSDVRPFTTTTQNSVVVSGLNLELNTTYYFAVRAINNAGLVSEAGVSDGIRVDPAFRPEIKIIPSAPNSTAEFSGIALLAPAAMSVVLKAMDANGVLISGAGVRNPTTVTLAAGQQYARLVPELFGIQSFDGWIEVEASGMGLGIYTATGSWDMKSMDGSVAAPASADFMLFHPGASAALVNPSTRTANVTITPVGAGSAQSFLIPARSRTVVPMTSVARVRSSEALAALERSTAAGKLAMNVPVAVLDGQTTLVFPHAVIGGGYVSLLTLANLLNTWQDVTITCGASSANLRLDPNSTTRVSIAELLQLSTATIRTGAVRVVSRGSIFGSSASLLGVLDIENQTGLVTMGARPARTEFAFPHVAHGNGLFTGLCFATGDRTTIITIEIYPPAGGTPKTATITMEPNQQLGRLISELVPAVTTQMGGYIRIRSDQPIWSWEIYGSSEIMASGPPL